MKVFSRKNIYRNNKPFCFRNFIAGWLLLIEGIASILSLGRINVSFVFPYYFNHLKADHKKAKAAKLLKKNNEGV